MLLLDRSRAEQAITAQTTMPGQNPICPSQKSLSHAKTNESLRSVVKGHWGQVMKLFRGRSQYFIGSKVRNAFTALLLLFWIIWFEIFLSNHGFGIFLKNGFLKYPVKLAYASHLASISNEEDKHFCLYYVKQFWLKHPVT